MHHSLTDIDPVGEPGQAMFPRSLGFWLTLGNERHQAEMAGEGVWGNSGILSPHSTLDGVSSSS